MLDTIRQAARLLGRICAGCLLSTRALGGTLLDLDETAPALVANNMADPQIKLAGTIMLLFAGGLSLLSIGYVLDSLRSENPPSRGA